MLLQLLLLLAAAAASVLSADPLHVLLIYETNNPAAGNALNAVQNYLANAKITGFSLASVNRVTLDSTQKYLSVDDVCSVYDKLIENGTAPHLVMDLTGSGISSEVMKALTKNLGLPTVSGSYGGVDDLKQWRGLKEDQLKYLIQVMPPGDIITQLPRNIMMLQNITNAAVLYDDSFDLQHQYNIMFRNTTIRHMISKLDMGNIKDQLKKIVDLNLFNFFILGKTDTINRVLMSADQENLFGKKYAWYTITKEVNEIYVKTENASLVFAYPTINRDIGANLMSKSVNLKDPAKLDTGFYFDLILKSLTAVRNMMDSNSWPTNMTYTPCSTSNLKPVVRTNLDLRKAFYAATTDPVYTTFKLDGNGRSYANIEMTLDKIAFKKGRLDSRTNIGLWKAGMSGNIEYAAGQSLQPFQPISVYRVVVVLQAPFVMKRKVNGTIEYYGYCIDLLKDIQALLRFEYVIYEAPDGIYGNMDKNMNWNGMIKELIDKRAEIGLGALAVMAERENVIDFTVPYYDLVGITILMSQPTVSTSLFKFLTVLENDVWGCILGAYFFTSILLWIFDRWSPYSYQNNKEKYLDDPEEEKREFSLKESLWFCMTSLTPQGGGETPKHLSGRLIAATWWLFGFIIIASYTANLAAFLTVSRLESPVNSLDDLATQYKIQYAPMNGSDAMTYFERMAYIEQRFYEIWKDMSLNDSMTEVERSKLAVWDYPVSDKYTKIWQSMRDAGLPKTFEAAVERVRGSGEQSDGFAFLGDATDIRYQVLTNCDLQMVGEEFSRKPYAVAVQDGSPLRDLLNDAILRLLNQRRLETLKERWWTENPERKVCTDQTDQSDGISIQNIGGVFIVIFVGITLACITLAIEYCWYKCRRHPECENNDSSVHPASDNSQNKLTMDDVYKNGRNQPYILDPSKKREDQFNTQYGYYGAKNESSLGSDGPRPRKAW